MSWFYKLAFDVIIWVATSKQAREVYKHALYKAAEMNDWSWDDELLDQLYKDG